MSEAPPLPDTASVLERWLDGIQDESFQYIGQGGCRDWGLSDEEDVTEAYRAGARDAVSMMDPKPAGRDPDV